MKLKRLSKIIIGEIEEYTKMMAEAREQAIDRMVADAINMGANGIVGIRFSKWYRRNSIHNLNRLAGCRRACGLWHRRKARK
jgi:uncharacterized protein YbjQ (UPF0145 family)